MRSVLDSLRVEALNPPDPDRASVSIKSAGDVLEICFSARDFSSARMIVNTYLGLAATAIDTVILTGGEKQDVSSKASTRA
ncbi:MAG: KEOPS complex subunit Pcc1 [Thermoproteota archaeon]